VYKIFVREKNSLCKQGRAVQLWQHPCETGRTRQRQNARPVLSADVERAPRTGVWITRSLSMWTCRSWVFF